MRKTVGYWFNVRPHPGLLPKEKENHSPPFLNIRDWLGRTV
jgi:hypothetical protein